MADAPRVRYRYPLSAILVLTAAYSLLIVDMMIITCTLMWLPLFPVAPVLAGGFACLLVSAHEYANSVRVRVTR